MGVVRASVLAGIALAVVGIERAEGVGVVRSVGVLRLLRPRWVAVAHVLLGLVALVSCIVVVPHTSRTVVTMVVD